MMSLQSGGHVPSLPELRLACLHRHDHGQRMPLCMACLWEPVFEMCLTSLTFKPHSTMRIYPHKS